MPFFYLMSDPSKELSDHEQNVQGRIGQLKYHLRKDVVEAVCYKLLHEGLKLTVVRLRFVFFVLCQELLGSFGEFVLIGSSQSFEHLLSSSEVVLAILWEGSF